MLEKTCGQLEGCKFNVFFSLFLFFLKKKKNFAWVYVRFKEVTLVDLVYNLLSSGLNI